jgi:polo-like kinase 1
MQHPFMTSTSIPKTLPRSTLACPPSKGYCDQFQKNISTVSSQVKLGVQYNTTKDTDNLKNTKKDVSTERMQRT